jgi:cell wall-associated NlpC family hydrolase
MGTPYKWGGTSRSGLDCSGLLLISFRSAGIDIPRTSSDQSKMGKEVSLYQLKPGDLVFFAAKKHNRRKITHVGLVTYVHGNHNIQFIHASTKLGVVENNIYTDYYRRIFVKARRVF